MKIAGLVAADVGTSAGETVIAGVDTSQYMSAMVLVEADMVLVIVELVEAIVSTGGGFMMVLAELLPVRTRAWPYVSSGSSNNNGSIGGDGGDEGRVMGGGSSDEEQSPTSGISRPCIIIVISSLLVLFLNHLV